MVPQHLFHSDLEEGVRGWPRTFSDYILKSLGNVEIESRYAEAIVFQHFQENQKTTKTKHHTNNTIACVLLGDHPVTLYMVVCIAVL